MKQVVEVKTLFMNSMYSLFSYFGLRISVLILEVVLSQSDGSAEEAEEFVSQFIDRSVDNLTVVFDFDGLPGFANSWSDEFIGRLVLKFPSVTFRMRGKELSKHDFEYFNESIEEWRKMGKHPNSNFKL